MNIDEFIASPSSGDCRLLKRLYEFDRDARTKKLFIWGLTLLDIEFYRGTGFNNPAATPSNSVAFATTGGDDVHFGLVEITGTFSDSSPVVMTVPMAGDNAKETNFIVGETLHDFLRLGCVHGFFHLENLAYPWKTKMFLKYSQPPSSSDDAVYEKLRAEFALTPWSDIESRLQAIDNKYWPALRFQRG